MARRGDTKPLCHVAQMIVALSGVNLWPLSGGKSLLLCQPGSPSTPRAYSSRRRCGSPVYLGRAVTTGPHTRGRSLSWGVWTCSSQPGNHHPASQERPPQCGTARAFLNSYPNAFQRHDGKVIAGKRP